MILLLASFADLEAQSTSDMIDPQIFDFAKRHNLIKPNFLNKSQVLSTLNQALNSATDNLSDPLSKKMQIFQRNNLILGDSIGYGSSFFSDTDLTLHFKLGEIPLALGTNIRNIDGQFSSSLSTVSLSFEKRAYEELLNKKFWDDNSPWEAVLDQDLFGFSNLEKELILREYCYTFYQQLATSERYMQLKEEYFSIDTTLLSEEKKAIRDTLLLIQKKYKTSKEKLFGTDYGQLLALEGKSEEIAKNYDFLPSSANAFPNQQKAALLSKSQKLVQSIDKFQLGFQHLRPTDYVCTYLPVSGVGVNIGKEQFSTELFVGRQAFSGNYLPSNGLSVFDSGIGNSIMLAQVRYENNFNNATQFTFLRVVDQPSDTLENIVLPQRSNHVFGFETSIPFKDKHGVNISAYSSFTKLKRQTISEAEVELNADNLATEIAFYYQPKSGIKIETGYFRTGANYQSFADPFQLRNRQGGLFDLQLQLFKKKLSASYSFKLGLPSGSDVAIGAFVRTRSIGTINYFFGKGSQLSVAFIPNTLRLQLAEEEIFNRQSIVNANLVLAKYIKKKRLLTQVRLSNYLAGQYLQDTATYINQFLFEVGEIFQLSEKFSFEVRYLRAFGQELSRLNSAVQFSLGKNLRMRINGFASGNATLRRKERGINSQLYIGLGKRGTFSIGGSGIQQKNYLNELKEKQNIFFANSSLFWTI